MRQVLGVDRIGLLATFPFQPALTSETYVHYLSNLESFVKLFNEFFLDPLEVTPVDIERFIAWLSLRGTLSAISLTPYLSTIDMFHQYYALSLEAPGPLVARVRKDLTKC